MKILIVDDNENFRLALKTALEYFQLFSEIAECTDGDEVLPYLEKNGIVDCILMDISMKRLDGLNASKLIRTKFPFLPIIILSMHDEENYYATAKEIGVSAFLLKSIELKELIKVIKNVLKIDLI